MRQDAASAFKEALVSTTRALARCPHTDVVFGGGGKNPEDIVLPAFNGLPEGDGASRLRGEADSAALKLRYHDAALHTELKPPLPANAALFTMLEQVRVEALGSRHLPGVQYNLLRRFEERAMQQ